MDNKDKKDSAQDEEIIPLDNIADYEKPYWTRKRIVHLVLAILPIAYAILNTIQTTEGMKKESQSLKYAVAVLYLFVTSGLNTRFTFSGIEDLWRIIGKNKTPKDWPTLTHNRKILAITLTIIISSYITFSDGCQGYLFGKDIPKIYLFKKKISTTTAEFISVGAGVITGIGALLNELIPTAALLYRILSSEKTHITDPLKRWGSSSISRIFAGANALSDGMTTGFAMKQLFKVNNPSHIAILGSLSLLNSFSDGALNDPWMYYSLNALIDHLRKKCPDAIETISFLLALSTGVILGYAWKDNTELALNEIPNEFNINATQITDPIITALSWGSFGNTIISSTAVSYLYFYLLLNKTKDLLSYTYSAFQTISPQTHGEIKTLLPKETPSINYSSIETEETPENYSHNRNLLFANPEPEIDNTHQVNAPQKKSYSCTLV